MHKRRRPGLPGRLGRSRSSPQKFADFYDDMAPSVYRHFLRETHEHHRALDLTAETFSKAFEKLEHLRGSSEKEARSWLWRIARTELLMFARRKKVERAALDRLGFERREDTAEELREIEQLGTRRDIQTRLGGAVSDLPPEQREVLHLRFVDDMSYIEIAKTLGITSEAARTRASRALRALRNSDQAEEIHRLRET